ncbi:hypothetical protein AB6V29_09370 [Microbacterium sp. 20-116]|uniref:hypothetical protein n=1 Tax=Microbacterium sp. 20-116 TaxID=3239883 RepID=UPI0034E1B4D4
MSTYEESVAAIHLELGNVARSPSFDELSVFAGQLAGRPLVAVGSGGTAALAELAALAHRKSTGRAAWAMTPLTFAQSGPMPAGAVVLIFSARAKHPDTALAFERAQLEGLHVLLVTERSLRDLPDSLKGGSLSVLTVPSGPSKDGFLATGSVVRMAAVVSRMYGYSVAQPPLESMANVTDRVIVLHGLEGIPAATDLETRLHELGLATVQRADFRNFAHGRHVGYSRHSDMTTIIALTGDESREICIRTLGRLPAGANMVLVSSDKRGVEAAFELLVKVLPLPITLAKAVGVEPSRPPVPSFGRALYHLPYKRALRKFGLSPVGQKLRAAGLSEDYGASRAYFSHAYEDWRRKVASSPFVGVLVDYDGTCVATRDRWDPPSVEVREPLVGMMRAGVRIAVASGRGDSLFAGLREWIPKDLWWLVDLGLHNGSWQQNLADDLSEPTVGEDAIADAGRVLLELEQLGIATIKIGARQISLSPVTLTQSVTDLRHLALALLTPLRSQQMDVRESAHSVDVFPSGRGKVATLDRVQNGYGRYLSVGDQGGPGGNDFDLLHASIHSITVGRTSPDPSRCWPVFGAELQNEVALSRILRRVRLGTRSFRFTPPILKAEHGTSTSDSEQRLHNS